MIMFFSNNYKTLRRMTGLGKSRAVERKSANAIAGDFSIPCAISLPRRIPATPVERLKQLSYR
jgi:hypothetical protein